MWQVVLVVVLLVGPGSGRASVAASCVGSRHEPGERWVVLGMLLFVFGVLGHWWFVGEGAEDRHRERTTGP
jgi:hypothetical protein